MEAINSRSPVGLGLCIHPQAISASRQAVLWVAGGTFTGLALFVLLRVSSGALLRPLTIQHLLLACLLLGIAGTALRRLAPSSARYRSAGLRTFSERACTVLATLATVVLAVSLAAPQGWTAVGLASLSLLAVEILARQPFAWPARQKASAPTAPSADLAPDVWQHWNRARTTGGGDVIDIWQRVSLLSGQRTASVHLSFCPPFDSLPQLSCRVLEGPEARLEIIQLWPYAARIDLRLNRPALAATAVQIAVRATCPHFELPSESRALSPPH